MRIINFGSLNIDKVYGVDAFVQPGQTISARTFNTFCGGKGLNQSIAAARAGANVVHAGAIGPDGGMLRDALTDAGVDVSCLQQLTQDTGHAVIQVDTNGENCIIVNGGTNTMLTREYVDDVLGRYSAGDIVLLQNEVSCVDYIIHAAHQKGYRVAFNPSPITPELLNYPLEECDWLILNELEGAAIAGAEGTHAQVLAALHARFPQMALVLTLGGEGVLYQDAADSLRERSYSTLIADTTAAGDTFCGYFLTGCTEGLPAGQCLTLASRASAIAVSRPGASASIPLREEVEHFK